MKSIFCGNFEHETRQSDLDRLFSKYGKVERVDMKAGFAFISMDDERDAEDAIRALDQIEFGRQGRRLRVDWTKQDRGGRRPGGSRSSGNSKPTKTLFVINFDPMYTRTRDLEKHFDPYGKILSIRIRRNFAFVQYESQEDATKALDATNMSKLMDQVVSVEYAVRDDDGRNDGRNDGRRDQYSPEQRGRGRDRDRGGRSPSPRRRQRDSPDYGHGPSRDRVRHASPHGRDSPDYGRANAKPESRRRDSPDYDRDVSPDAKREMRGSPYRKDKDSPDVGHRRSPSPHAKYEPRASTRGRDRDSPVVDRRSPSPHVKYEPRVSARGRDRRDSLDVDGRSPSPQATYEPKVGTTTRGRDKDSPSPHVKYEPRVGTRGRDRDSPDFRHGPSRSPSPQYAPRESSPLLEKNSLPPIDQAASLPIAEVEIEPKDSPKSGRTKEKKHRRLVLYCLTFSVL
ncbi:hypothetical protein ACHQM5_000874 [Ranunculus cassubicifolius]